MKRLCSWLLALGLLLSLAGCGAFDKSYYELSDYTAQAEESMETDIDYISDYTTLKRAITWIVSEHQTAAQLQFQNYDGNISRDISQACWEVKSSTPLGAFAIDYTSCDLSRIVSFYQADLYITYRRSAEQVEALEQLSAPSELAQRLNEALHGSESYLVLELASASLSAESVRGLVRQVYYSDALAAPCLPEVEVSVYPESGMEHILEISLDYGMDSAQLDALRSELSDCCAQLLQAAGASDEPSAETGVTLREADRLYTVCRQLAELCLYDPAAGATAHDALVLGRANAEGMALACQALCEHLGLEARVVEGRLDNESHFWNMITVDGLSCHVDMTDPNSIFLVGDEKMLGRYWWDTELYPACPTNYDYFGFQSSTAE